MGKKRHLTPAEIKEQCKRIARESRMADRTPWTAMGIICSYVIMRREGFKGQRISRLANKVNEMEADWSAGKVDLKEIRQRLMDKAGWSIEYKAYTEDKTTVREWSRALLKEAGVVMEPPVDPLTQTAGSIMTG